MPLTLPHDHNLPTPRALQGHADLPLELGGTAHDVALRGFVYGQPLGNAPVFVLAGGITADALPLGDGHKPGWWQALEACGLLQVDKHTILAPGTLGNVSDWPALRQLDNTDATDLPRLTPFDLAEATEAWLMQNACPQGITWIGASVGGLVGLALALRYPRRIKRLITISAGHKPDAWGTGVRHLQRELVRDALGQPLADVATAMKRARQLGMLSYRGRDELNTRFGRLEPEALLPPIANYLDHNGEKFAKRFSPQRFLLLSDAIDRFHIADLPRALQTLQCTVTVVGVPSDLLFPLALQAELNTLLHTAGVPSRLLTFESPFGHDAFLADQVRLAQLLIDEHVLDEV
jgi:homoserine O-acetyltransferase